MASDILIKIPVYLFGISVLCLVFRFWTDSIDDAVVSNRNHSILPLSSLLCCPVDAPDLAIWPARALSVPAADSQGPDQCDEAARLGVPLAGRVPRDRRPVEAGVGAGRPGARQPGYTAPPARQLRARSAAAAARLQTVSSARAPHTAAVEREGGSGLIRRMMATVVGFERPYSSLSGSVPVLANLGGKQHHLDIIFPLFPSGFTMDFSL